MTNYFLQKWQFEVKAKHTISKDEVIATAEVTVDDYVQKNQDLVIKLTSRGGNFFIKKVASVAFRLYARYVGRDN